MVGVSLRISTQIKQKGEFFMNPPLKLLITLVKEGVIEILFESNKNPEKTCATLDTHWTCSGGACKFI